MYTNNRDAYRQTFYSAWQKHIKKLPLESVEAEMIAVLLMHPEYHPLLENSKYQQQEFTPEENPFLHLSLHMAIREQINMNRPAGISNIYEQLMSTHESTLDVEHYMITILANVMWQAQETGNLPNEDMYLQKLKELL
jgi:hypothetical protein